MWFNIAPWRSGYHYGTTSFNKVWTQILRRLKPCSRRVRDLRWWESLTMVPAGNKALTLFFGQPYHKNNSSTWRFLWYSYSWFAETNSEPRKTSKMELFAQNVNGCWLFSQKISALDIWITSKYHFALNTCSTLFWSSHC